MQNSYFTTGTGTAQPQGFVTAAPTVAGALDYDSIIDLIHAVDPEHRINGSFQCHDTILKALRKITDSSGRPVLWSPRKPGEAERLLGYPILPNRHMVATATSTDKPLAFGDFSKYKVRDQDVIRIRDVSEPSGVVDLDQRLLGAFMRSDGRLLDAGSGPVKVLQIS